MTGRAVRPGRVAFGVALGAVLLVVGAHAAGVHAQAADLDWRKVATPADRERLREWRDAWVKALAQVRGTPSAGRLASDPVLFDPDRALEGAALRPGSYRCRLHRLGARDTQGPAVLTGSWTGCRVADTPAGLRLVTDGMQRTSGTLFDSTDARTVFLGTLALGDEDRPMRYGRDARRDMAGVVERIGERRWRLVLPYPGFQSTLDVMEIVPS